MKSTPKQTPGRKPYREPTLVRYGDLARITNTVGAMGKMDGGAKPTNKTAA